MIVSNIKQFSGVAGIRSRRQRLQQNIANILNIMKTKILIIALVITNLFAAPQKKNIHIYFNPAKFTTVLKGDATLFKYKDKNCKYVIHEPGSPVLPCIPVYVLVPKGAVFRSCIVRAEAQPLCGEYKLYCRKYVAETALTAKRYPPKLAEFVGCKVIDGYTVFEFRTYPLTCQPGDNSVNRIIQSTLTIKYIVPENGGLYNRFSSKTLKKIKRLVVNPDDLAGLLSSNYVDTLLKNDPLINMRNELTHEVFATKIERNVSDKKPDIALKKKRSAFDKLMEDELFIDDNDIVYAPINF